MFGALQHCMKFLNILLPLAVGVFALGGAVYQWEFFMSHPKARFLIRMLGRTGTRLFYAALGVLLIIFSAVLATKGLLKDS